MNIPLHNLKPRHLFALAHVCSLVCTLLVYAGTRNTWLALATSFALLTVIVLNTASAWHQGTLRLHDEDAALDHRKVSMPEPRKEVVPPHDLRMWNHRPQGHALPQVLFCIAAVLGAHALLIVGYLIICAVFGAQEPRW